jgi:hypothetical protein
VPVAIYGICHGMRFIGMNDFFVSSVEVLDEGAAVLILALAIVGSVRRAIAKAFSND